MSQKAGDEELGKWVYCKQHLRPHSTGWCTVPPDQKVALQAETHDDAYKEVRAIGFYVFGAKEPIEYLGEDVKKELPGVKLSTNYPNTDFGRRNKVWFLDLELNGHVVTVQFWYEGNDIDRGKFGITAERRLKLVGKPDETILRADDATARVVHLLRTKERT